MNLDESRYQKNAIEAIRQWSQFLQSTREFLYQKGYLEITTSFLVEAGAFESTIDPLQAYFTDGIRELHTSPEMEMKRLIAEAKTSVFQIAKCFRDDPDTTIHGKEFSMLEFYKMDADYAQLINEVKALFTKLSPAPLVFKEVSIHDVFLEVLEIDLDKYPTVQSLSAIVQEKGLLTPEKQDTWEDLFFKLMIEKIEPSFDPKVVTVVKDYPAATSVLSKTSPNPFYSERFEIYYLGIELCNGCTEATSVPLLEKNYLNESEKRKGEGKDPHPKPHAFLKSMKNFPNCSGVAIGLDRLFLCLV
mgnify:CR=1 FL=1